MSITRYVGQQYFVDTMTWLGHTTKSHGQCAGVLQRGVEDFLLEDLPLFNQRFTEIHDGWEKIMADYTQLETVLKPFREKQYKRFFKSIRNYQKPEHFKNLLGNDVSQFTIEKIANNRKYNHRLMEKGDFFEMAHYLLPFVTPYELKQFLLLIASGPKNMRFAVSFSANRHRTGFGWDNGEIWFINANALPCYKISLENLPDEIFSAHFATKNRLFFSVRFCTLGQYKANVSPLIQKINDSFILSSLTNITKEKKTLTDRQGNSLVYLAANYNHLVFLNFLLEVLQENPNKTNGSMLTALHIATNLNHHEIVFCLLNHPHICINMEDDEGHTPLFVGAKKGHLESATLLLKHGADPQLATKTGKNAVTIAAKKGHLCILKLFHQNGVNLTQPDQKGKTALHYATKLKYENMCLFLESSGTISPSTSVKRPAPPIVDKTPTKKRK